jgi:hypothetical protein
MRRLKAVIVPLAVTGALAGGGAAIANAASGTTTTSTTSTSKPAAPARPPKGAPRSGSHHCPGMGGGTPSSSAPAY